MKIDGDEIRIGDITVSLQERRIVAGGREIDVTSREFGVLAALASHPGWVFSTEQLCGTSPESYASPGAVGVHVSHLRRKLADAGFPGVIETVRGAGYRMRRPSAEAVSRSEVMRFAGRSDELATLAAALADARGGTRRFVFITGETGIGKTALAERAISDASRDPPAVVRVVCAADGAPQYWMWRQIVRGLPQGVSDAVPVAVRSLVGEGGGGDAARSMSPAERMAAYDAVVCLLREACTGPPPVVLFIDDLQWARESSLSLLGFVLRRAGDMHLLVIATCREEDLESDEGLARFVAAACDSGGTLHLRLAGLDLGCVAEIVAQVLGERTLGLARRIHALAGGNPLFVRELVQALAGSGDAAEADDTLEHLPATIDALVRAQVAMLPQDTRRALTHAAAIGVEFDSDILGHACGSDGGVVVALEPALRARVVEEIDPPGRFRFRHPVFRQALYEGLSTRERQRIHADVFDAIRSSAQSRSRRVFGLAHHAELAGPELSGMAVGYLAAAEREARARCGFGEASRFARRALRLLDASSLPPERAGRVRAVLLERFGTARAAEGEPKAAIGAYRTALRERGAGDRGAQARLHTRIAAAELDLGEWDECRSALALADECLDAIRTRSERWWSDWIYARLQRAEYEFVAGDDSGTTMDPALRDAVEAHATSAQRVSYLEKRAAALWRRERFAPSDRCVRAAREAARVTASPQSEHAHARAVELLGGVLVWSRDFAEAEEVLEKGLTLMRQCRDPVAETRALFFRAISARLANDVGLTDTRAHELLECASVDPPAGFTAAAKGCLAWAAFRREDREAAERLAREAMDELRTAHAFPHVWTAAWPLAASALAAGRLDETASAAAAMLDDRQERLPDAIEAPLRDALDSYRAGDPVTSVTLFEAAAGQAALFGYA